MIKQSTASENAGSTSDFGKLPSVKSFISIEISRILSVAFQFYYTYFSFSK